MVFEKPLDKPVANWNISGNKFVFIEETQSTDVYLVKLFLDKQPVVFKFVLPISLTKYQVNSHYDPAL